MVKLGIHKEVAEVWSNRVCFNNPSLHHRKTILNLSAAVDEFKRLQTTCPDKEILGIALKMLFGFMVPLVEDPKTADAHTPWVFDKSGEHTSDLLKLMFTSMESTRTWAKLKDMKVKHQSKGEKQSRDAEKKKAEADAMMALAHDSGGAKKTVKDATVAAKLAERLESKAQGYKHVPLALQSWAPEITDVVRGKEVKRCPNIFEDAYNVITTTLSRSPMLSVVNKRLLASIAFVVFYKFLFQKSVTSRGKVIVRHPGCLNLSSRYQSSMCTHTHTLSQRLGHRNMFA